MPLLGSLLRPQLFCTTVAKIDLHGIGSCATFVSQTNTCMTQTQVTIQDAAKIAAQVTGKNVVDKRIKALKDAGLSVSYEGIKWNFGRACTQKGDLIQLHAAHGCSPRRGISANRCEVYRVSVS